MEYIYYPGCLISYRFPFIDKMTRLVMERLNIKLVDEPRFTCCPDPQGIQSYDEKLWILAAARNMAIAEKLNLDIFTICNGCYSTFRKVSLMLKEDPNLFDDINFKLDKIGLEFKGKIKIKHLHEVILKDYGIKRLYDQIENPLNLKVAIHYGCHLTKPSTIVEFNDNYKPKTLELIIMKMGGEVVEYEEMDACCGGSLNYIEEMESFRFIKRKIMNIMKSNADCIAVTCPYCFLQFEMGQIQLQKQNFEVSIPVLHLSEILGMGLGINGINKMLRGHKIKCDMLLEKHRRQIEDSLVKHFDLELLKNCARCRACSQDCSLISLTEFDPLKFVDLIVNKQISTAIQDKGIWYCLNCYSCLEKCPQRVGLAHLFIKLRNLAIQFGYVPDAINTEFKKFSEIGIVTGKLDGTRKRLNLPIKNMEGIDQLKKIMLKNKVGADN
ncbi:MAG: heterodisulfide reductase-related iron-sulfur binding cluster [Candidatus Helarchaeota archaeon]